MRKIIIGVSAALIMLSGCASQNTSANSKETVTTTRAVETTTNKVTEYTTQANNDYYTGSSNASTVSEKQQENIVYSGDGIEIFNLNSYKTGVYGNTVSYKITGNIRNTNSFPVDFSANIAVLDQNGNQIDTFYVYEVLSADTTASFYNYISSVSVNSVPSNVNVIDPNAYSTENAGTVKADGSVNGFKFSEFVYEGGEKNTEFDSYLQLFSMYMENVSSETKTLWCGDFYLKDPNGRVYNLSNIDFYRTEGGYKENGSKFRPGEGVTFKIRSSFYGYDTLVGSTLYYNDTPIHTF